MTQSLLRELACAGPEHLDPAYVAGYDRKAGFDPTADLAALREGGLGPDSTVVDLGAGTGTFAISAARVFRRVVAVDVSPAMTAALRRRVADTGLANVECVEAGFLSYEHAGAPADAVFTRNALHHLPDFWKALALRRIADLMRPGGILRLRDLVYSFDPADAEAALERWLATRAPSSEVGWTREELETHVRDEYSTFAWLLEPMLERADFTIERAEHDELGIYATYTCTKR
jgi:SAM-dependent methyltransferase